MKTRILPTLFLFLLLFFLASCGPTPTTTSVNTTEYLYVGTFFGSGSEGMYVYSFDRENLSFSPLQTVPTLNSPSFLTTNQEGSQLFSVTRGGITADDTVGAVQSFSINPENGQLTAANQVSSHGKEGCHITLNQDGTYAFVSHYTDGSLGIFPINEDGTLGEMADSIQLKGSSISTARQEAAHAHAIQMLPDGKHFAAADLGSDKIWLFSFENGQASPASIPFIQTEPGGGPRHFTFLEGTPFLFVGEELTSTVSVFSYDLENGTYEQVQRLSSLPEDYAGESYVADIHISPDNGFLYVSNRGHHSLAIFSLNAETGQLVPIGYESTKGDWPRNFMIDPQGEFILVANERSDDIWLFKRDIQTGLLTATDIQIQNPSPVCLELIKL